MKKVFVLLVLVLMAVIPSLASAGGSGKGLSLAKPPSQPRFQPVAPPPPAVIQPAPVQPAPPAVSRPPVQRREIVIRREERIVHDYRYTYRYRGYSTGPYYGGYYGGGTEIGIFISPYRLVEWRNLPFISRPPVCRIIPAHWEERERWQEAAAGFQTLYIERVWVREGVICR